MESLNISMVDSFNGVLDNLVEGEEYLQKPPRGPRDSATLSESELSAKELNENGESPKDKNYDPVVYRNIEINNLESTFLPIEVKMPTADDLDGIVICGIDGSNQKVEKNSFYFILARAAIINFKYSKDIDYPYFYQLRKDASAVTEVDGNIFKENVIEHTNNKIKNLRKHESANIIEYIKKDSSLPFLVKFDHTKQD
ncbi:MAG TPA: hypothetical protein PKA39_11730, partial [Ignavibacteria bacterium]|nr:hypothetical protein [Ignavibacteria bacterium]